MRMKLVQHEMLPQQVHVFTAQFVPAAITANKAGIEGINLGSGDDFLRAARVEGPQHVNDIGRFQNAQVI